MQLPLPPPQVVGTAEGELLVVAEGEVKQALQLEGGGGVECLAAFSKVGGGAWAAGLPFGSLRLCTEHSAV